MNRSLGVFPLLRGGVAAPIQPM